MSDTVDPSRLLNEYLSGGSLAALAAIRQALPQYVDDVSRDFGGETYEKMQNDAAVGSALEDLKLAALADGITVAPAVEMPTDSEVADPEVLSEAERAKEMADFVRRCFDGMDRSIAEVADELLDGLALGSKVAEIVMKHGTGVDSGRLVLKAIKGKNWRNVAYVVDQFMEVQGVIGSTPKKIGTLCGTISEGEYLLARADFLPPYKYLVFRNGGKDGDPRGQSVLRKAYNAWFLKTQVVPDYYKFLRQFASPGIIGKTAIGGDKFVPKTDENGKPITDANGQASLTTAEMVLFAALMAWINASVLVVPGGTEIDLLKSEGSGEAFLSANDWFDRQINMAILGTTRMTMEAQHGSKADSGTAQDVFGLRVAKIKRNMGECLTRFARWLIEINNFGEDAINYAPTVVLTKAEQQDWAAELSALADAYGKGFIHDSQLQALDARLGLPERDMEQIAMEKAESAAIGRLAAGEVGRVMNPAAGLEDDPEEEKPA